MRLVILIVAATAAWAQSNAITLCDQQSAEHCMTYKAPASLTSTFVIQGITPNLSHPSQDVLFYSNLSSLYLGLSVIDKPLKVGQEFALAGIADGSSGSAGGWDKVGLYAGALPGPLASTTLTSNLGTSDHIITVASTAILPSGAVSDYAPNVKIDSEWISVLVCPASISDGPGTTACSTYVSSPATQFLILARGVRGTTGPVSHTSGAAVKAISDYWGLNTEVHKPVLTDDVNVTSVEIDMNNDWADFTNAPGQQLSNGLVVTAGGQKRGSFGLVVSSAGVNSWYLPIWVNTGCGSPPTSPCRGMLLGSPDSPIDITNTNAAIGATQMIDGQTVFFGQRFTDTNPTGAFWEFYNRTGNKILSYLDMFGNQLTANNGGYFIRDAAGDSLDTTHGAGITYGTDNNFYLNAFNTGSNFIWRGPSLNVIMELETSNGHLLLGTGDSGSGSILQVNGTTEVYGNIQTAGSGGTWNIGTPTSYFTGVYSDTVTATDLEITNGVPVTTVYVIGEDISGNLAIKKELPAATIATFNTVLGAGTMTMYGGIVPNTAGSGNLGSSSLPWNTGYFYQVRLTNNFGLIWPDSGGTFDSTHGGQVLFSTAGDLYFMNLSGGAFNWWGPSYASKMSLDSSGNLLIGTATDSGSGSKLQVNGTMEVYGNIQTAGSGGTWNIGTPTSYFTGVYSDTVTATDLEITNGVPVTTVYVIGEDISGNLAIKKELPSATIATFNTVLGAGTMTMFGSIVPSANDADNIGASGAEWLNGYFKNITVTGTCTGCGSYLPLTGGTLTGALTLSGAGNQLTVDHDATIDGQLVVQGGSSGQVNFGSGEWQPTTSAQVALGDSSHTFGIGYFTGIVDSLSTAGTGLFVNNTGAGIGIWDSSANGSLFTGITSGTLRLTGAPTTCTGHPTGTIANIAGVATFCP